MAISTDVTRKGYGLSPVNVFSTGTALDVYPERRWQE